LVYDKISVQDAPKKAPVLTIATRGALWIGPVKIPGAAGFSKSCLPTIAVCPAGDVQGFAQTMQLK